MFLLGSGEAQAQSSTTNYPPMVSIVRPMNNAIFYTPIDLVLAAEARDADGIAAVQFFAGTTNLGAGVRQVAPMNTNVFTLVWSNAPPGVYALTAVAADNAGLSRTSLPVNVWIQPGPPPPPPIQVTIQATDPVATEPGPTATVVADPGKFTVFRNRGTNIDLTVFYRVGGTAINGVDYASIASQVVIPKGALSADINIVPRADNLAEGIESVVIHLVPPVCVMIYPPPPECYQVATPAEAVVSIRDGQNTNPPPTVVTVRAPDAYASEPCTTAVIDPGKFTVFRNGPTNADLVVSYAIGGTAQNGIDYREISNTVVIPQGSFSADIPIVPLPDTLLEGAESVVLHLLVPPCAAVIPPPPGCYLVGQPAEAAVYIRDCQGTNYPPLVKIVKPVQGAVFPTNVNIGIVAETVDRDGYVWKVEFFDRTNKIGEQSKAFLVAPTNGTPIGFEMTWSNVPPGRHVLNALATDNQGLKGRSPLVEITVGTNVPPPITNTIPVVTIVATDPLAIEGTNCWGWPNPTNRWGTGTTNYMTLCPGPTSITQMWWFTNCGPKNATLTVRRTGDTNTDLTVFYLVKGTATNGVDYEALPGTVVIPAGERKADILIVPKDDLVLEYPETVVVKLIPTPLASPIEMPTMYVVGYPDRAGAVIVDSNRPRPTTGMLSDRCFYLGTSALDGSWFRIEHTSDFQTWTPVCTNQVIQGTIVFVDPEAQDATAPARFYRAMPEAPPADY